MSTPYRWNGTLWVPVAEVPSIASSAQLNDTDLSTVTTLAQPTTPRHPGDSVSLSATVKAGATPVTAGSVSFERLNPGGSWTAISTDSLSPWTASYPLPSTLGTYKFRAKYLGSGSWAASTSAEKSVVNEAVSTLKTWSGYASASRSYEGDYSLRADNWDSRCYHGYYSSTNGRQRSAVWFSVPSEVKGSVISEITIRLTRIGSLGDSSVTINMGTHKDTSVPGAWDAIDGRVTSQESVAAAGWSSADVTFTRTLGSEIRASFEAGAKGLLIGPPTTDSQYGAFHGVAGVSTSEKPYLTIKYTA